MTKEDLPDTIKRSPEKAQETFIEAHNSAVESYGDGERAHRTAYAALKHSFEKVGDHWELKEEKGPSDPQAKNPEASEGDSSKETFGGVDYYGSTKEELYDRAKELDIEGRSRMDKKELARAIDKAQD